MSANRNSGIDDTPYGKDWNFDKNREGLTNYWRDKRAMEVLSWTPLSDTTFYDRVEAFLHEAKGHITEPAQLLGDFQILVWNRFYCDTERMMRWCLDHPDSQVTRGLIQSLKDINPEWTLSDLQRIKDPQLLARSKKLLGLK